jgi:hypothetical protein
MLAYVFWHWSKPDVAFADYEQYQRGLHAALATSGPSGFLRSASFRIEGQAPWLGGAPAYVDWYLVEDSAALDPLNVAAVSGVCEAPHTRVAQAMSAGAGLLMALHDAATSPDLPAATSATFLTKPRDMPYATFYETVTGIAEAHRSTLWRRMMVLGPTPEFAVLSRSTPQFPSALQALPLRLSSV